jgi:hypothetical protein
MKNPCRLNITSENSKGCKRVLARSGYASEGVFLFKEDEWEVIEGKTSHQSD